MLKKSQQLELRSQAFYTFLAQHNSLNVNFL